MPLHRHAFQLICEQLTSLERGQRVTLICIGTLTEAQFGQINFDRGKLGLPDVESPDIVYLGRHHFQSRSAQGYTCQDMAAQLESALADNAIAIVVPRGTTLQSTTLRADGYGNMIRDQAVLELTARKPRIEVFSVIPKGDRISPKTTKPR